MSWLREVIQPSAAYLFLVDEERKRLELTETIGCKVPDDLYVPLGLDLWRWLEERGIPSQEDETLSRYGVPISFEGSLYGTLCVISRQSGSTLRKEQRLTSTAAGFLAPVLRNIQRYQTLERRVAERTAALAQSEARHRRLAERLRILREIDQAILAAQSPEDTAQAALSRVRDLIPCMGASITSFDFETKRIIPLATSLDAESWSLTGRSLPFQGLERIIEKLSRGIIHRIDDLQDIPPPLPPTIQFLRRAGARSYLAIPLIVQGKLIGSLCLGADKPTAFTDEDVEIAREVANSLAIALHQVQLFQEIREQREQLRALAKQLDQIEEAERRRLARELHDRVGQNLTALSISLSALRSRLSLADEDLFSVRIDDAIALVEEITQSIRDVMADLRPAVLDDYGLLPALRWFAHRFAQRTGLHIQVLGEEDAPRLPPDTETALFRITQEALTNVAKHAQAQQVTISLESKEDMTRLVIADDGVGFDFAAMRQHGGEGRWGLHIMRERAEAVGGQLRIDAAPGKGTQVIIEIPHPPASTR
ncbi:MAG: GAF domain-containing sensor histidine kinase [Chloroflexi bacterium]|nr:GAF domain-containing sensor histidine kinase [Chloroflexota bacterium]